MPTEPVILIVGDDLQERDVIVRALAAEPYQVVLANSSQEAVEHSNRAVDVVITELEWGQFNGLELLREWKSRQPQTGFILLTDGRDVSAAVEAMKLGAADCLVKPVNAAELRELVRDVVVCLRRSSGQNEKDHVTEQRSGFRTRIDIPPGTSLDDLERAAVRQALAEHHGNRTHAAKTLGISVRTLQRKLKAWDMPFSGVHQLPAPRFVLPSASHTEHSTYTPHANY